MAERKITSVVLSADELQKLHELARASDMNMSQLVRSWIRRDWERREKKNSAA